MLTEKQLETSRLNAAILARREKRQTLANSVTLPAECTEQFIELLANYRNSLRPVGFLEERVVETLTVSEWHRRRYWILGMAKVAHATALQEATSDDFTNEIHGEIGATQTAIAVSKLADTGRSLEFFRRCDTTYSREHRFARKELKELQTDRFKREQAILDDGGDSLDFDCYKEDAQPEKNEPQEKITQQTEPNNSDTQDMRLPAAFRTCGYQPRRPSLDTNHPQAYDAVQESKSK